MFLTFLDKITQIFNIYYLKYIFAPKINKSYKYSYKTHFFRLREIYFKIKTPR